MTTLLIIFAFADLGIMTLVWFRQRATKNANSVDMIWALGIGLQTALMAYVSDGSVSRRFLIAVLVGFWALRLGGHLFVDRVLSGEEDGRYARFRREWTGAGFYGLFIAQAVLVFLLPFTFYGAMTSPQPFPVFLDYVGLAVWVMALLGEWTADFQLARFKSNPSNKGKTCREGLWRYSRHPNYFFEWIIWCAYIPLSFGSPAFIFSVLGPCLMLFLILKVSGIPPTEAQAVLSRGDDYREYQRSTSAFIPWFPKEK